MQQRPLGSSNIQASVVGLGTWAIGGWAWGGTDEAKAVAAIEAALDAGMNLIDTAPAYGFGTAERILGRALRGRRDKAVLATKCGLVWNTTKGQFFFDSDEHHFVTDKPDRKVHRYLAPQSIRAELERSLQLLGTDYVDLYQTHWQDPTTPIDETMGTLLDLKKQGKIRAIGVSNVTPEQLAAYRRCGPIDSDQEHFSMLDRKHEPTLIADCRAHGTAFLAYSPLAQGLLTGKLAPDRAFPADDVRHGKPRFSPENRRRVIEMLNACQPIARRHKLTLGQLVIRWTVAQPGVTHALVGARDAEQAMENAKAGAAFLPAEDVRRIDEAFAVHAARIV